MTEPESTPKKKRYPSQDRYNKKNPTITIRLKKDTKELLDKCKGELSQREFIRKLLMDNQDALQTAYNEGQQAGMKEGHQAHEAEYMKGHDAGYEEGITTAKKDYEIGYLCVVCKELMIIVSNDAVHKAVVSYLFAEGWGHKDCIETKEEAPTEINTENIALQLLQKAE